MGILETAKDLASLIQKLDNIELNEKILQLQKDAHDLVDERGAGEALDMGRKAARR